MKICLDAGHYGKYNCSPCDNRYYESEMVWKLHLLQKKYLEDIGVEVVTTRSSICPDLVLHTRGAKSAGCDLFISDHSNATGSGVNAKVDYPVAYCSINGKADGIGFALARCIQNTMGTKQEARIEHRMGQNGDYYGVLRGATNVGTPALILEHSFHTNPVATEWLLNDNNLDKLARAEVDTIARFYSIKVSKVGWVGENGGFRFYLGNGQYVTNDWYKDNDKWYWFDGAGMMVSNTWYYYKDRWYYFGTDGAMATGQITVDGKWYVMDDNGAMITESVILVPDASGALYYRKID